MSKQPYTESDDLVDIAGHTLDVTIITPAEPAKGTVLFLHGAGESTKDRCLPLARALAQRGYKGVTFSFPGHGASSGSLLGSTLAERQGVAEEVIQQFTTPPISLVVAVSMGAHIAISMLQNNKIRIERLALLVPAIYSQQAETVPFGPEFSAVIRRPNSYLDAKAWDILPTYRGKLATIQTGKDEVIPPVIYDLIDKHAAVTTQHVLVADSPHRITTWLSERSERVEILAEALDSFSFEDLETRLI